MKYKYFYREAITDEVEIEDIGNCNILAYNDYGSVNVLIVRTQLGLTSIMTYGPIQPDVDLLPKYVKCTFKRIEYNPRKISKEIDTFLNNPVSNITSAIEVDFEEAISKCRSIIEYIKDPANY